MNSLRTGLTSLMLMVGNHTAIISMTTIALLMQSAKQWTLTLLNLFVISSSGVRSKYTSGVICRRSCINSLTNERRTLMPIDYKKYPANWKTEIVPAVIERAKDKCEWCELANKQVVYAIKLTVKDESGKYKLRSLWFRNVDDAARESGFQYEEEGPATMWDRIKTVQVCLTVAHLDHDELNHEVSIERLRALCQLCHLRYDATEKYRRVNAKDSLFPEEVSHGR